MWGRAASRSRARANGASSLARVEALGYSTLNVGDHLVGGYGPIAAIAAAADATDTLRVGALTFGNDYRHPVVLAQETATLDVLSEGRLEVGIGAGWMRADYERAGMTMDEPGVRVDRLAEAVTVLKQCWSDEPCTFSGRHYRVDDLDMRTRRRSSVRIPRSSWAARVHACSTSRHAKPTSSDST